MDFLPFRFDMRIPPVCFYNILDRSLSPTGQLIVLDPAECGKGSILFKNTRTGLLPCRVTCCGERDNANTPAPFVQPFPSQYRLSICRMWQMLKQQISEVCDWQFHVQHGSRCSVSWPDRLPVQLRATDRHNS